MNKLGMSKVAGGIKPPPLPTLSAFGKGYRA